MFPVISSYRFHYSIIQMESCITEIISGIFNVVLVIVGLSW